MNAGRRQHGPTSGLFTVALWAYGVGEGLPVVRANTILNLSHGNVWLEEENGAVCFCCEKYVYDGKTCQDNLSQPVRLPLTIQNGAFQVKDGYEIDTVTTGMPARRITSTVVSASTSSKPSAKNTNEFFIVQSPFYRVTKTFFAKLAIIFHFTAICLKNIIFRFGN